MDDNMQEDYGKKAEKQIRKAQAHACADINLVQRGAESISTNRANKFNQIERSDIEISNQPIKTDVSSSAPKSVDRYAQEQIPRRQNQERIQSEPVRNTQSYQSETKELKRDVHNPHNIRKSVINEQQYANSTITVNTNSKTDTLMVNADHNTNEMKSTVQKINGTGKGTGKDSLHSLQNGVKGPETAVHNVNINTKGTMPPFQNQKVVGDKANKGKSIDEIKQEVGKNFRKQETTVRKSTITKLERYEFTGQIKSPSSPENSSIGVKKETFVTNTEYDIKQLKTSLNAKGTDKILSPQLKTQILAGAEAGTLDAKKTNLLIKQAKTAGKYGIKMRGKDGTIQSLAEIRLKGLAKRQIVRAPKRIINGTISVIGSAGSLGNTASNNTGENIENQELNQLKTLAMKPVSYAGEQVKRKTIGKVANTTIKAGKKIVLHPIETVKKTVETTKEVGMSLVRIVKRAFQVIKGAVHKILLFFGPVGGGIFLVVLCVALAATSVLTSFAGTTKTEEAYQTIFNAETTEFAKREQEYEDKLRAKCNTTPPAQSSFTNEGTTVSDEEYASIQGQFKPDYVTTANSSNIDYKAQLALWQILGGARNIEKPTALSDILGTLKYWIDKDVVEYYTYEDNGNAYEISWIGTKNINIDISKETDWLEQPSSSEANKIYGEALAEYEAKLSENGFSKSPDSDGIKPEKETQVKTVAKSKEEIEAEQKKDPDKKVNKTKTYYKYTVKYTGSVKVQKRFSRKMLQTVYSISYNNGDYDDYVKSINEAYANKATVSLTSWKLGDSSYTISTSVSSDGTMESNKQAIWSYLTSKGLSEAATAGVMGNMSAESGFNPSAIEGNGEGHGLIQWSFGRKTTLLNMAKAKGTQWDDLSYQLDFLWNEVFAPGSSYRASLEKEGFFTNTDVSKTAYLFHKIVEVSSDTESAIQANRVAPAKEIYNQFKGKTFENISSSSKISGKIIWVGDSRTVGMQQAVGGSDNDWVCKSSEGYNWFVSNAIGQVNNVLKDGETIVFNFGVNDLGNVDKYISKLNSLANGDWKKAKIVVMSVNPTDSSKYKGSATNTAIEKFNSKMKSGLNSSIKYVDTYSSIKNNFDTTDGLHYTTETYNNIYGIVRGTGTSSTKLEAGYEIEMPQDSKHFNHTYYFEQLIKGKATRRNYINNPDNIGFKNHNKIATVDLEECKQLYSSDNLMEDFTLGNATTGGSFGFNGDVKNAIKRDNEIVPSGSAIPSFRVSGNPFSEGQCTWYAWSRFYQLYGYGPCFTKNGQDCAQQLWEGDSNFVKSSTPAPGAIFSCKNGNGVGHVGVVEAVEGDTVWWFDGNYMGSGALWLHKATVEQYKKMCGWSEVVFAVPVNKN